MRFSSEFSKKSKIILIIVATIVVASTIPIFFDSDIEQNLIAKFIIFTINFSVLLLLYWMISKTHYTIKNETLICKSGPFKKSIQIKNINQINDHNGIVVPCLYKLSLSHEGIIIRYNKCEEIYISPKNKQKFINELIQINPNILSK